MIRLRLTLLGGLQARLDSGTPLALPTRKAQALLAYLAVPAGQAHPRDKLAAVLWGGIREESARASLRQALFAIRRALGEGEGTILRQAGDTLALDPTVVETDVATFEHAVREATPASLERAAELYRGDLLAGLSIDEAPFDEWLLGERERLRELALEALARLLTLQRKAAKSETAVGTALRLLALDPLQESVHRTLMRLYAELGRRGTALKQYQHCVTVLQRELGVEPEPETKHLYQEILRQRSPRSTATDSPVTLPEPGLLERPPAAGGTEAQLIGRAAEMSRLRSALDAALGGAGRVIGLLGEAGVGKSRLVAELVANAAERGATLLIGRAYESEQILPFGPWVDALRLGHVAEELALLERLGPALRVQLARLLPEIGGGAAATPDGATDVRLVFESVTRLIGELSSRRPVVVVLEDLHWADEMTARLLEFVGRRLRAWPVLLLTTARDDELGEVPALLQAFDDLERDAALVRIAVPSLSQSDTLALVRVLARTGDEPLVARLAERAWAASEGNPFVVVEMVRAHAEGTPLVEGRALGLPAHVREIVGRRLERLSEHAHSLGALAAVIGREFDFALLHRAAGLGEDATAAGVEELVRRRVLHTVGERFDFTHDYIREVAFGRILSPRRTLLHRRVAEAIESLHAADLRAHALALGQHFRDAGVWDRAARYLSMAGEAARFRAANREAVACYGAVLDCLGQLPESREKSLQIVDTLIEQEIGLMGVGEFRRALDRLREAEALARDLGDRVRLCRIFSRVAYHLASIGDLEGAAENAEQARTIAIETGDLRAHTGSNVQRARALYALGDYRRTIEAVDENDGLLRADLPTGSARINSVFWPIWGVLARAELGEFAQAIARGQQALEISPREFGPHGEAWARLGVGRLYLVQGDLGRAIEVLERGLPICEVGSDLEVYFSRTAASLGGAYALSGRMAEALALLDRADRHAESLGFAYGHALVIATLAEAKLLAGDIGGAARHAARALERTRRHGQRGWEAWTLRLHADLAIRERPARVDVARRHFHEAIALAEERGMRPLRAHCRLGLGTAYRLEGTAAPARDEIEAALADYRAMEMPYWRARAVTELAGLD